MTNTIYISYARQMASAAVDEAEAVLDKAALSVIRGVAPAADAPYDLTADLESAIEKASAVALLWDDAALHDPLVRREVAYALCIDRPVIAVGAMPEDALPIAGSVEAAADVLPLLIQRTSRNPSPETRTALYVQDFYRRVIETMRHRTVPLTADNLLELRVLPYAANPDETPTDFHSAFAAVGRRTLLLGLPGMGKSALLLGCARDAAAAYLLDPDALLPVYGDVSQWDSRAQPHLVDWLAESSNGLNAEDINEWLSTGRLFMLLDGLDEMSAEREEVVETDVINPTTGANDTEVLTYDPRQRFVDMLSEALMPDTLLDARHAIALKQNAMLITFSIEDYESVGALIPLNDALVMQPLTSAQLDNAFTQTPIVREHLHAISHPLRTVPLYVSMLWHIAAEIEHDRDAMALLFDESEPTAEAPWDISDRFFATYIEARYIREAQLADSQSQPLPLPLHTLRDILGRLAVGLIVNRGRENNAITPQQVKTTLNILEIPLPIEIPTEMAVQLDLMTPLNIGFGHSSYRFTHMKLRDHLAFAHAVNRLVDQQFSDVIRVESVTWLWDVVGERAAIPLLSIARSRDDLPRVRRAVIIELGERHYVGARDPLLAVLSRTNDDTRVRQTAARVLGYLKAREAIQPLINVLLDRTDNQAVREEAARALGRLADDTSIPALIDVLRDGTDELGVRKSAAHALWPQGGASVLYPLVTTLQMREVDTMGRILSADALGELAAPEATEALIDVLQDSADDNYVRYGVARALQRLKTPTALDAWEAYQRGDFD